MLDNKKILVGMLALVGVISAGVYSVSAYQGDYTKHGPNYTEERHKEMTKAFESNDYDSWKKEMEEHKKDRGGRGGRVLEVVNKDNFAKFSEAHRLGEAGDKEGADKIRKELGLRTSNGERGEHRRGGEGEGRGHGEGRGKGEHRGDGEHRGENKGGHFEDNDHDGKCDHMDK